MNNEFEKYKKELDRAEKINIPVQSIIIFFRTYFLKRKLNKLNKEFTNKNITIEEYNSRYETIIKDFIQ